MRRRCDGNRLGSIAAMLSALSAFLGVHQTQAENAPRVSWISPTAFSPSRSSWRWRSTRTGLARSIRWMGQAAKGAMSPEELRKVLSSACRFNPNTLAVSAPRRKPSLPVGFPGCPYYFTEKTLASAKVVFVEPLPIPPLRCYGTSALCRF